MNREALINLRNRLVTHGDQFNQAEWWNGECGCLLAHALLANGWTYDQVYGLNFDPKDGMFLVEDHLHRVTPASKVLGISLDEANDIYWGAYSDAIAMDDITAEDAIAWIDERLNEEEPE